MLPPPTTRSGLAALLSLALSAALAAAEIRVIEPGQEPTISGKELDWISGDYLMSNDRLSVVIAAPLASTRPDGLEMVAMQGGFINQARAPLFEIIPDYLIPGMANESLATIMAGLLGILIIFGVGIGVAYNRRKGNIIGR